MTESLCYDERKDIERYILHGYSTDYISHLLARSPSCIKKELKENYGRKYYNAFSAQKKATNAKKIIKKSTDYRITTLENEILILKSQIKKSKNESNN